MERATSTGLLQALGARYIVLRRDLDTAFPGRSLASPDLLAKRLAGVQGVRHLRGFGEADVYEAPGVRMPEVYPALPVIEDEGSLSAVRRAVAVPRKAAVVGPEASDALAGIPKGQARVVTPKRRLAVALEHGAVVVRPLRRTAGFAPAPPLVLLPAPDPPFERHRRPPAARGLGLVGRLAAARCRASPRARRRAAATSRRSASVSVSRWRTASATATGMTIAPAGR